MHLDDDLDHQRRPGPGAAAADTPPDAPDVPGYSVGGRLGAGGSGTVWAATRETDGAPVAVKVVTVAGDDHGDAAVRELGVLATVAVEGVVPFHEAVTLPGEDRRVALVLDLVTGGSLQGVLAARGHLSVGEAVTVLAPVARALAGLHAAGVVHGDVTPGNVLLERSGRPLLADLGVARLVGEVPGEAWGTEGFVAPEVLDGAPVSPASDVYAAGALAWRAVTGEVPGPPAWREPLESLAPGLPAPWCATTTAALSGDPALRPSAAEAALAWFDSAECEPLRLVVGTDETSLLTHRLRRSSPVLEPTQASVGTEATWCERLARAAGRAAGRGAGRVAGRAARPRRRVQLPRGWASARVGAALAGLGLGALLLVGVLMASDRVPAPSWLGPPQDPSATVPVARSSKTSAPTRSPVPTRAPAPASVPAQRDHAAAQGRPVELMQALADLRATAMTSGRVADLSALDAPGSSALARDTADLGRLGQAELAYEGVRLTVRSASAVRAAPTPDHDRATIEAVVDTAAYRVVAAGSDGSGARTRPAVSGQQLRFGLVWSGGRWLVDRVEPVG